MMMPHLSASLILCIANFWIGNSNYAHECDYYIADSKVPGFGRGVFSGKRLYKNESMFDCSTVLVRNAVAMETMLAYYVFTDENEDYEVMMFGPMLMLNHADKESVDYTFTADPVSPPRHVLHAPYTQHTSFLALSAKETAKGTELFTNYGKQWFKDRRIARNNITSLNTSISYSAEALRKEGRCLSDIRVGSSSFPFAGKGAFATKSFARGEVVSVSPVLVLPLHAMEMEANHSVLLNYCISSGPRNGNKSDVALLPLSQAAMMNHGPPGLANVKIDWFEWPGDREKEKSRRSSWTAQQLEEAEFAPLDLQYIATKDIKAGEELLLFYGHAWEEAWMQYLDRMMEWYEILSVLEQLGTDLAAFEMTPPQFRAPVGAPGGLFPDSFFVDDCLGPIPCRGEGEGQWDPHSLHGEEEKDELVKAWAHAAVHFKKKSVGGSEL